MSVRQNVEHIWTEVGSLRAAHFPSFSFSIEEMETGSGAKRSAEYDQDEDLARSAKHQRTSAHNNSGYKASMM